MDAVGWGTVLGGGPELILGGFGESWGVKTEGHSLCRLLSTFGLTTLLLGGAFSKECVIKDVGRRLPWAPGWSFKLKDCTVLSLSDAGLGDSGVKVLAASLAAGGGAPNVVEVNLSNNGIGDEGCVALADALSSPGSGLATLYLERNAIGDRGAIALGAALERNTALETLGLLGNELTDAGRAALHKARFAGSGLSMPGAEDEYQRLGSNGPARVSAQQQQQPGRLTDKAAAAATRPPPPAPHPPPQAAPPACRAMLLSADSHAF
ncbi:hypothetical protein EMIHUDRAFT_231160 [Emiliania huxleyi CCMP1516]|uniref:Uncharacterized protein n=2 Tax=Emiliania huxleyi TaxID=2903 RepID=A0A0D3K816_EMIH1|nr:hypothetical protein EMIHUDRAFT_231120 [Emiliania huxleyi CCMP1516]XP_005784355.1 hypothetical protein EMIHUDRAFT_231160 [Emiliania huxleyi CCMP1516]EOD31901.1 hypothetical protein EMIHUDRAFT_231120 [Emiliania huxleyi CCMP1516]EOD31926.1 hypothetical protein EMIHUDRAFT_231160 [Emiliania huxleyi CCMP1516]|eukprot:XP_005784330.1 hypothetical protein EMIHUDRAFT_231120 [Emiliania huxleyi CCMP1516]